MKDKINVDEARAELQRELVQQKQHSKKSSDNDYQQKLMEKNESFKTSDAIEYGRPTQSTYLPQFVKTVESNSNSKSVFNYLADWPLIPLFIGVTIFGFGYGLRSLKRGDSLAQQKMMRLRVIAQGAALAAMTYASYSVMAKKEEEKSHITK